MNKVLLLSAFLFFISCVSNNEHSDKGNKVSAKKCMCILDELAEEKTRIDSTFAKTEDGVSVDFDPRIAGMIKKMVDVDVKLRLAYKDIESEESTQIKVDKMSANFDDVYIKNYFRERNNFCAKYKAYCQDESISDSLKTKFYIEELDKLNDYLREQEENKKNQNSDSSKKIKSSKSTSPPVKQKNINGDNINISQGDNSYFDNRKIEINQKGKKRKMDQLGMDILIEKLRANCQNKSAYLWMPMGDKEATDIGSQIESVLIKSGWDVTSGWKGVNGLGEGINVWFPKVIDGCDSLIALSFKTHTNFEMIFGIDTSNYTSIPTFSIGSNPDKYVD